MQPAQAREKAAQGIVGQALWLVEKQTFLTG